MSVITRAITLTQDEIEGSVNEVDLIKILTDNHELDKTINDTQCASEEIYENVSENYADVHEADGSDQENAITNDDDVFEEGAEFPPMISAKGKQPGSTRYIWAGYVYARDGYTRSFRCSNRKLYQCPGRAIIKDGIVNETKAHSHPREPHIVQVEKVKQDMILRAKVDKSVGLRTIYLEACRSEPLVRTHLGLDMMLNKMKKARNGKASESPEPKIKEKRKLNLNFKWTKDWLEIPSGQDKKAFCKLCSKEIVSPTKTRVYKHFLSKMHKRAVLGLYRPPNKQFQMEKQNEDPSNPESDQEDTYDIEVLDQFQDEVERTEATKRLKKPKTEDHASFYEEVIKLQASDGHKAEAENDFKILNGQEPPSIPEMKLSRKVNRVPTISVHVWDSNTGQPVSGLEIFLYKQKDDDSWSFVNWILSNDDGKCCDLLYGGNLTIGHYKLKLDTRSYYSKQKQKCLYPYVEIVFEVEKVNELYHFPVQLSQFAYNVCRLSKS